MPFAPALQVAYPEIIGIIDQQFLKTRFCHIGEFYFSLARSRGGLAPLRYILFSGTGCLNHLVDRSVTFAEEPVGEKESDIVYYFRFLIHLQLTIATPCSAKIRAYQLNFNIEII